jgi:pimeloyl-ACP methyl ester carboxylesterase
MPVITVREGAPGTDEHVVFYLNGWGDLPFCSRGVDGVSEEFKISAWVPPAALEAARLVSVERVNQTHIAETCLRGRTTLVGYSHGGLAALTAARQIGQHGGTDVRLVILDSVSPQTYLRMPLEVEFCRSAPFFAPEAGPLVEGLRTVHRTVTGRAPTADDFHAAIDLVARNATHMADLAADFDPRLTDLEPADLVEKLTDWLCFLLLLRGIVPGVFAGPVEYVHSREGRENALRFSGDEDREVDAWRRLAPALVRHYQGDRHWGLLTDIGVRKLIFGH